MHKTNSLNLSFDTNHLMSGLKAAFSGKGSILTELMQNARRARATQIDVTLDETSEAGTLVVEDDGDGIVDFQQLLTIAGSNWQSRHVEETPFGVGFCAALLNAKKVIVESNGKALRCDTEAVLAGASVDLEEGTRTRGTKVILIGMDTRAVERDLQQEGLADGFPVPIVLNGQPMARSCAEDAQDLSFRDSPVGKIHIDPETLRAEPRCFLQGIPVDRFNPRYRSKNVVHLDPAVFKGRFPDRRQLQNEAEALEAIAEACHAVQVAVLEQRAKTLANETFIKAHFNDALALAPALLNDIELLPGHCFHADKEVARDRAECYNFRPSQVAFRFSKSELFAAPVVVAEEYGENGTVLATLTEALGGKMMLPEVFTRLDAKHWLHEHASVINDDDSEQPVITVHNHKVHSGKLWADEGNTDLIVCDRAELSHPQIGTATLAAPVSLYTGIRRCRVEEAGKDLEQNDPCLIMHQYDADAFRDLSPFVNEDDRVQSEWRWEMERVVETAYLQVTNSNLAQIAKIQLRSLLDNKLSQDLEGKRLTFGLTDGRITEVKVDGIAAA